MVDVDAFLITNGVSQYGQVHDVTFAGRVVEAAQLSHFTVLISCLSSLLADSFKKLLKSVSIISVFASGAISFFAPQYSHVKEDVPGKNFKLPPQSLHLMKFPTSAVFSLKSFAIKN